MPKKRQRKEADITPKITRWLLENYLEDCLVEIKIKGKKPKPHQMSALNDVRDGCFAYKFPDGHTRTPCDVVILKRAHPLVITYDPKTKVATAQRMGTDITFSFRP